MQMRYPALGTKDGFQIMAETLQLRLGIWKKMWLHTVKKDVCEKNFTKKMFKNKSIVLMKEIVFFFSSKAKLIEFEKWGEKKSYLYCNCVWCMWNKHRFRYFFFFLFFEIEKPWMGLRNGEKSMTYLKLRGQLPPWESTVSFWHKVKEDKDRSKKKICCLFSIFHFCVIFQ